MPLINFSCSVLAWFGLHKISLKVFPPLLLFGSDWEGLTLAFLYILRRIHQCSLLVLEFCLLEFSTYLQLGCFLIIEFQEFFVGFGYKISIRSCSVHIFSQSLICLNFSKFSFWVCPFFDCAFGVPSKNSSPNSR